MRRRGCLHSLIIWAAVGLIAAGFWQYENNIIAAEPFSVPSERLPAAFDGLRIAVVSDLHGKTFGPGNETLLDAVEAAESDLIAITGDLADETCSAEQVTAMVDTAAALDTIAPAYYISGNHEWVMDGTWDFYQRLEEGGVRVLHNEYEVLERDGQQIVLAGVDDPNGPWDQKTPETLLEEIRAAHGDVYTVLLAHRNEDLPRWAALGVDVVLCGHAHGGVIRLPFVGGLLGTDRQLFPEFTAGLFTENCTSMVVSRGLGNSGVPFRLFNRPHIPVVSLETVSQP